MNRLTYMLALLSLTLLAGCDNHDDHDDNDSHDAQDQPAAHAGAHGDQPEAAKGPNGGRLLVDGDFALELTIFETGMPPEFRVWVTDGGQPVAPEDVDLNITLTRLGGVQVNIGFEPRAGYLRGDTVVYEPHSFMVTAVAGYQGETHRWEYDSFEGRTKILPELVAAFDIASEIAGPASIREYVKVYGNVVADPERESHVMARFDGAIKAVKVSIGDRVTKGQTLAVVESNESLRNYNVAAPIDGMIVQRHANSGEQTGDQLLFTIVDTSAVWAELAVFPRDLARVQPGQPVTVWKRQGDVERSGSITLLNTVAESNQAVMARVLLDNADGKLVPGMFLTGEIEIDVIDVPLAVKRVGLQSFRDFTVVYAQVDDEFEMRMLELGRQDDEWVEVLGGLDVGTRYVTTNSYVIKADIEKSGATHDH